MPTLSSGKSRVKRGSRRARAACALATWYVETMLAIDEAFDATLTVVHRHGHMLDKEAMAAVVNGLERAWSALSNSPPRVN